MNRRGAVSVLRILLFWGLVSLTTACAWRPSTKPSPQGEAPVGSIDREIRDAVAEALLTSPEDVWIPMLKRHGSHAVAAYFAKGDAPEKGCMLLRKFSASDWGMKSRITGIWSGDATVVLVPVYTQDDDAVYCGFVDQESVLVTSVDPVGQAVDETNPVDGAVVLSARVNGQLRTTGDDGELNVALPAFEVDPIREAPDLDSAARKIAIEFMRALVSPGWELAKGYLSSETSPDSLPNLRDLVSPPARILDVAPEERVISFAFNVERAGGDFVLDLVMLRENGEWKVSTYVFAPARTP